MKGLAVGKSTGSLPTEIGKTECMDTGAGRWVDDGQSSLKFSFDCFYFRYYFLFIIFFLQFFRGLLCCLLTSCVEHSLLI